MWSAAADVVNRVADDDHVAAAKIVSVALPGARDRDRRQVFAVRRVATERAERKVVVQFGTAQLDPRAAFDVARQQREGHAGLGAKRIEKRANAVKLADARPLVFLQIADVRVPQAR